MSDDGQHKQQLADQLERWRRYLRTRRGLRRAALTAFVGMVPIVLGAGILCIVPFDPEVMSLEVALSALAALVFFVALAAFVTARTTRSVAAAAGDLAANSGALFSTAEELLSSNDGEKTEQERAVVRQAAERARTLKTGELASIWRYTRIDALALSVAFALALPWLPYAVDEDQRDEERRLAAVAEVLQSLDEPDDDRPATTERLSPDLRRDIRRLREKLEANELDAKEASEQLGELKRALRTEQLTEEASTRRAGQGARDAARVLGRDSRTSDLARRVTEAGHDGARRTDREAAAARAGENVRRLAKLSRNERKAASETLQRAAEAADEGGNWNLGESLRRAGEALQAGDENALNRAADDLSNALSPGDGTLDEVAEALEQAQRRLSGVDPGDGTTGDGRRISPTARNWSRGEKPKAPGDKSGSGAGKGTALDKDDAADPFETKDHQDADRFTDDKSRRWEVDFRELYDSELRDDTGRVLTRVKGEKDGASPPGRILRGGAERPAAGPERARRVMEKLPVRYREGARKAMDNELVPAGYRDPVREYFAP